MSLPPQEKNAFMSNISLLVIQALPTLARLWREWNQHHPQRPTKPPTIPHRQNPKPPLMNRREFVLTISLTIGLKHRKE